MENSAPRAGHPDGHRRAGPTPRHSPAREVQIRRLRRRVSTVLAATLAISLALAWATAVVVSRQAAAARLDGRLDDLAVAARTTDQAVAVTGPGSAIGPSTYLYDPRSRAHREQLAPPATVQRAAAEARQRGVDVRQDGRISGVAVRVMARGQPTSSGLVVVTVVDRRGTDALVHRVARDLALALCGAFTVSVVAVVAIARRSTRHLEQVFRQEDRLVLAATHELRGPLSWMAATASEGLRHGRAPTDALAEVGLATRAMADLLDDLTEAARVLSGASDRADEPVRLDLLVASLVEDPGSPEANLVLDLTPTLVQGSRGLLRRASANLVRNAARHGCGGHGGPVAVRVDHRGITVSDDGPGMAADQLATLRRQIPSGIRIGDGGTGLGLALAAWVAQIHDGQLEVANRFPHGFEATLRLPTADPPPTIDPRPEEAPCECS